MRLQTHSVRTRSREELHDFGLQRRVRYIVVVVDIIIISRAHTLCSEHGRVEIADNMREYGSCERNTTRTVPCAEFKTRKVKIQLSFDTR